MKNILLALVFGSIIIVMSCGDGNVTITPDATIQETEDSATIVNYLADLGYEGDEVGNGLSGVRYVVLDSGSVANEAIEEGDIVTFFFIGKTLNDTIFDTSIEAVGDSIRLAVEENLGSDTSDVELVYLERFPETRTYAPYEFTYSESTWTTDRGIIGFSLINGFRIGFAASLKGVRLDGTTLIVMPSSQAYGTFGSGILIEPNEVIAFELHPVEVIKQ
ncbi:MAG: FKBP-type peptidyl-prolyl cis-trans isomerase [Bacteroidota bacterium]